MRKLTPRFKTWLIRRALREMRRHRRRVSGIANQQRIAAFAQYSRIMGSLPRANLILDERPGYCVLRPPSNFDLVSNYEETLTFLMEMRGRAIGQPTLHPTTGEKLGLFSDFSALEKIAPGAGLVLAAELDRRRMVSGRKPRSLDAEWDPDVRAYFCDAGLFHLLGIDSQIPISKSQTPTLHAVPFMRGRSVKGQIGAALRDQIEALCGKKIGPRFTVYEALSEAIANTRHAYPAEALIWPTKAKGQWWASGTWDSATDVVSIQLYDQGVGIPFTLPRSEHWSSVLSVLGILHPERTDDRLLMAALEIGRTSTGQQGRGKGLAEMASWIDKLGNGFLRITSGRGMVTYQGEKEVMGRSLSAPFCGTLIEWEIGLGN